MLLALPPPLPLLLPLQLLFPQPLPPVCIRCVLWVTFTLAKVQTCSSITAARPGLTSPACTTANTPIDVLRSRGRNQEHGCNGGAWCRCWDHVTLLQHSKCPHGTRFTLCTCQLVQTVQFSSNESKSLNSIPRVLYSLFHCVHKSNRQFVAAAFT